MYTIAACVAEKLTGQTWEELVQNMLFDPLGMEKSTFIDKEGLPWDSIAEPHVYTGHNRTVTPIDRDVHRYVTLIFTL